MTEKRKPLKVVDRKTAIKACQLLWEKMSKEGYTEKIEAISALVDDGIFDEFALQWSYYCPLCHIYFRFEDQCSRCPWPIYSDGIKETRCCDKRSPFFKWYEVRDNAEEVYKLTLTFK